MDKNTVNERNKNEHNFEEESHTIGNRTNNYVPDLPD